MWRPANRTNPHSSPRSAVGTVAADDTAAQRVGSRHLPGAELRHAVLNRRRRQHGYGQVHPHRGSHRPLRPHQLPDHHRHDQHQALSIPSSTWRPGCPVTSNPWSRPDRPGQRPRSRSHRRRSLGFRSTRVVGDTPKRCAGVGWHPSRRR